MAVLNISFRLVNENNERVIHPTRNFPSLLKNEPIEHPQTLSNEIWDCINFELKQMGLSNKRVIRDSVSVNIDTDDGYNIIVPRDVIEACFNVNWL